MSLEDVLSGEIKVGMKQSTKLIESGKAKEVFIAEDADQHITTKIIQLCKKMGVNVNYVESMKELGKSCGIEVGAAVVTVANEQ